MPTQPQQRSGRELTPALPLQGHLRLKSVDAPLVNAPHPTRHSPFGHTGPRTGRGLSPAAGHPRRGLKTEVRKHSFWCLLSVLAALGCGKASKKPSNPLYQAV